jgi:5-dehydro-2-deoxygluconokinase
MFDVIAMGRIGVDIYPTTTGSLVDVQFFEKFLGGSPTNVAVAAARLGERSAIISNTGQDPFGDFVHVALRHYGVDDRYVGEVPGFQTPVTFCEIFPPDNFPIYFYRAPKAPDLEIFPSDLDLDAIRESKLFWATVSGLSVEPSRAATMAALESRNRKHPTVLDLDYRPIFWQSPMETRKVAESALASATVAIGNLAEVEIMVGSSDSETAAERLLEMGLDLVVVKLGPNGVFAKSKDEDISVPAVPVEVFNGLGAGDAFGGAFCHGVLAGWPLTKTIQYANAAGAIVASRLACSDAMPTIDEIDNSIKGVQRA